MAVGDMVTLDGCDCLDDKLAEIGSTVAIADNIALELVNVPKAEWEDYTPVDAEAAEDIQFAHEAAEGTLSAILAHGWDSACTVVGPQQHQPFWAVSMGFERPVGLLFL